MMSAVTTSRVGLGTMISELCLASTGDASCFSLNALEARETALVGFDATCKHGRRSDIEMVSEVF